MASVAIVIDYQNLHMTGHEVFMPSQAKEHSLISPWRFGHQLIAAKNASPPPGLAEKFELKFVDVFRGLPDVEDPHRSYKRNLAQKSQWEKEGHGRVRVTYRPLKYRYDYENRTNDWSIPPQEKGVDVQCALALCKHARSGLYDVVILASRDTDLAPAVDEAATYRQSRIELVKWFSPNVRHTRGNLRTQTRVWTTSLDEASFRASLDPTVYH
ncbi:PIN domain-containing protein [Flaviflexus massiliensis]|uniref:NYN domain-containing protein n=1 Tax=Flaviflexus massiliensis TaxID=1522309 RepID=UPI0006D5ACEE|nr:NYN domain-containing protein [Flaviflexus massiliensis]